MSVTKAELLRGIPTSAPVAAEEVAAAIAGTHRVLVVLDDDPTGTQSVSDLPVLNTWTVHSLTWAFRQGKPAVYVMTNSRSLSPADAEQRNREVARAAYEAAAVVGLEVGFVSRSDSTLRGHFPLETTVLAEEISAAGEREVGAIVLVPAFPEAGRLTVNGVHYAGSEASGYQPVGESEFAKDATFGYQSSDLREWVAEKTDGAVPADEVELIDLPLLRTDSDGVVARLTSARGARPIVVDVAEENDIRLLGLAVARAQAEGAQLLFRVGPPAVRALIGQEARTPLSAPEVAAIRSGGLAQSSVGGLIVVGSHVGLTTLQLDGLRERLHPTEIEIDVTTVLDDAAAPAHLDDVVTRAAQGLAEGNVVVRTSRTLVTATTPEESLALSRAVSTAVVTVVRRVLDRYPPRFVVAKGGITSSDVAARGLEIGQAMVRGPMLPGIVSLWEPITGPARGIPYVVFAGNVGGPESLADVVDTLSAQPGG